MELMVTEADGNCFFHSISALLKSCDIVISHEDLRIIMANTLEQWFTDNVNCDVGKFRDTTGYDLNKLENIKTPDRSIAEIIEWRAMATILRCTLVCFTSDMGNDLVHQFKPLYTADGDEMLPISTEGGLEINADELLRLPQQLHLAQFHHEHAPGSVRKSVQHIEPLMESTTRLTLPL